MKRNFLIAHKDNYWPKLCSFQSLVRSLLVLRMIAAKQMFHKTPVNYKGIRFTITVKKFILTKEKTTSKYYSSYIRKVDLFSLFGHTNFLHYQHILHMYGKLRDKSFDHVLLKSTKFFYFPFVFSTGFYFQIQSI